MHFPLGVPVIDGNPALRQIEWLFCFRANWTFGDRPLKTFREPETPMEPTASDASRRSRRSFSPDDKMAALREHFLEAKPISTVCLSRGIGPALFYQWQKTLFGQGAAAFTGGANRPASSAIDRKVEKLEAALQQKNTVIAEIMSEHVALKKSLGGD
jgi:transposase